MNLTPIQGSELEAVNLIVYHTPHIIETVGYVHPLASLFYKNPNFLKSRAAYDCLVTVFKRYNIHYAEVTDVLRRDKKKLVELAKQSTAYTASEELKTLKSYGVSEAYRIKVLESLDVETLLGLVYSRPNVFLKKDNSAAEMVIDKIYIEPLANLIFCRDQQIVTAKGLVLGNTSTFVRKFEKVVMKIAFEILKLKLVGEATGGTYLLNSDQYVEGGDFMAISKDLSLMQIGIRSNIQGAKFLMDNDLLGTRRFGVVRDEKDRDQQRMHLDTIFNLIDEKNVIMLDFDDPSLPKDIRRDIDIYVQDNTTKAYQLTYTLDFYIFLLREGYRIIKVSNKDQEEFMINFLNIGKFDGKYVLITSNGDFAKLMVDSGIDVTVEYIYEFKEVNKMHGSFHCVTQVFR